MMSSTVRDLPVHREKVRDACLRQKVLPSMMELWPAIDADGIKASLDKVDEADLYLGVFAFRYGYIPDGASLSVTEMEYNRAIERNIPRLVFLMHDSHPLTAADVDKDESAVKLQALKERLKKERSVAFFRSPEDLLALVVDSLSKLPNLPPRDSTEPVNPLPLYDPGYPVFSVPYRAKGDQVVGRGTALDAVRRQLVQGKRTAIGQTASFQGLGGLGKTQLAVEYAYEFRNHYPNGVIWLNADQDIDAQLTELAITAKWTAPEAEHKDKLAIARKRIKSYSGCLIVFDNLENRDAVRDYLPDSGAEPHILVTSRLDQPDFVPVPLDVLDRALSLRLLTQEAGRSPSSPNETTAAENIAELLGGLPLALELAGAFLRHRTIGWEDYRALLKENLSAALPSKYLSASFTRHESDLQSTLRINEQVFSEEPKLREVMDVLTWSAAAPMGRSLLATLLNISQGEIASALGLGLSLRLIQETQSSAYALHRLIREVRRDTGWLDQNADWVDQRCQKLSNWFESLKRDFADVPKFESEVDHLRAWFELAKKYAPKEAPRLVWLLAYPPFHRARYSESRALLEEAGRLNENLVEPDKLLEAHVWNDLSTIYGFLSENKLSAEVARKALDIRLRMLGAQHPDTAMSHNNVSATARRIGKLDDALTHGQRAYEIWSSLHGENHIDTALGLSQIGAVYRARNDFQKGFELENRTLAIRRRLFGDNHPDTVTSTLCVARCFLDLHRFEEAENLARHGLESAQALFGERSYFGCGALFLVAEILLSRGRTKEAIEHSRKCFTWRSDLLGLRHEETAHSAIQLANLLVRSGQVNPAFAVLDDFLSKVPSHCENYEVVRKEQRRLGSTTVRPGFRQLPKRR